MPPLDERDPRHAARSDDRAKYDLLRRSAIGKVLERELRERRVGSGMAPR